MCTSECEVKCNMFTNANGSNQEKIKENTERQAFVRELGRQIYLFNVTIARKTFLVTNFHCYFHPVNESIEWKSYLLVIIPCKKEHDSCS